MQSHFDVTKPEKVEFTLTVTTTLEEWLVIKKQLQGGAWPATRLVEEINDMLVQARKTFWPKAEDASLTSTVETTK